MGFEPTVPKYSVFKTDALDHSAITPKKTLKKKIKNDCVLINQMIFDLTNSNYKNV